MSVRRTLATAALIASISTTALAQSAPLVFFDIATPNLAREAVFYKKVFNWEIAPDGRFAIPASPAMPATLRTEAPGTGPSTERLIYIGVPNIDDTLKIVAANGGGTVFPRTVVPGAVILALFTDPAGNRMGLVEIKDGKAIVP